MATITESRMAMYEGILALAWADHELDENEKQGLHDLIDDNFRFTDAQRQKLHADVDRKVALKDIWPRITEKQDRAHLIDISSVIFLKDGHYCSTEKELYEDFLAQHMATLDTEQIMKEARSMADEFRAQRISEEQELKEYVSQFSLAGRLQRFLKNHLG